MMGLISCARSIIPVLPTEIIRFRVHVSRTRLDLHCVDTAWYLKQFSESEIKTHLQLSKGENMLSLEN